MRSTSFLAQVVVATTLWVAAAIALAGNAIAHPGHGAPASAPVVTPAAAAPLVDGLAMQMTECLAVGGYAEPRCEQQAEAENPDPAKAECSRACCVGGTPCAGAFALPLPDAGWAHPAPPGKPSLNHAAFRDGITPKTLPRPPRFQI